MSNVAKKLMQAAAGGGQESGNYIAVSSDARVTLLDHTVPGSLVFASQVTSGFSGGGDPRSVDFSPDGNYLAVAQVGNPQDFQLLDHTTPGTLTTSSSYTLSGNGQGVSFSPDGSYIAVSHNTDGTSGVNFTLLSHSSGSVSFSDSYLLGNGVSTPQLARGGGCSFSPDGSYIAAGSAGFNSSPDLTLLSRSGGSVSRSSDLSSVGNNCQAVAFSNGGSYIGVGVEATPHFKLVSRSGGSMSIADTYSIPSYIVGKPGIAWSPDDNYIAVGHFGSPYFTLLDHTSAGSVSLAATYNLGNNGYGVAFHPEGTYIGIAVQNTRTFTLLSHSSGSVSLAATYTLASDIDEGGCAFSPI